MKKKDKCWLIIYAITGLFIILYTLWLINSNEYKQRLLEHVDITVIDCIPGVTWKEKYINYHLNPFEYDTINDNGNSSKTPSN